MAALVAPAILVAGCSTEAPGIPPATNGGPVGSSQPTGGGGDSGCAFDGAPREFEGTAVVELRYADPLGESYRGRDRGMTAERHFGRGAEEAQPVSPGPGLLGEGGLGVPHLCGDCLPLAVIEPTGVQDDASRIAGRRVGGESGVAQDLGHTLIVARRRPQLWRGLEKLQEVLTRR